MKRMKKLVLIFLSILMTYLLTGCGDAYKKSGVTVEVDEKGKGYISQDFMISGKYVESDICKLDDIEQLAHMIENAIDKDVSSKNTSTGVDVTHALEQGDMLKVTLTMNHTSYKDFNTKVNEIIKRINATKHNAKIYDTTFGISVNNTQTIIAPIVNAALDEQNVAYDVNSNEYKYMITHLLEYDDEISKHGMLEIPDKVYTRPLKYLEWYPCSNETYKQIEGYQKKNNKIVMHDMAAHILEYYMLDVVMSKLNTVIDVEKLNERLVDNLIEKYAAYITRDFHDDIVKCIQKKEITDLSLLSIEEIERAFGSATLAERINSYRDLAPDAYVYLPTGDVFGVEEIYNEDVVYVNGQIKKASNKQYTIYSYKTNSTTGVKDNNDTSDNAVDKNKNNKGDKESDDKNIVDMEVEYIDDNPPTADEEKVAMYLMLGALAVAGMCGMISKKDSFYK